jgi:hypothetical protein
MLNRKNLPIRCTNCAAFATTEVLLDVEGVVASKKYCGICLVQEEFWQVKPSILS